MIDVLEWIVLMLSVGGVGLVGLGALLYFTGQLSFPINVVTAAQRDGVETRPVHYRDTNSHSVL